MQQDFKMNKRIDHIGIAVKNLSTAEKIFKDVLGVSSYKQEEVQSENVLTSFFDCQGSKIELLVATHPESAIAKFIDKKGEGIHHIAFEVPDLESEIQRLKSLGYQLLNSPKKGADDFLICFMHPKETNGVLVELCQKITHETSQE